MSAFLLFAPQLAAAESLLNSEFIRRFVDPAIDGKPLIWSGMTKAPPGSLFPFDYVANDQSFSVSRYRKGDLDFVAMYGEVEADTSSIPRLERRLGPTWPIKDESELREIIAEYEAWVRSTPGVKSDPTCAPPKHDPAIRNQTYLAAFTFATPDHRHGVFQLDIAEHMRHYTDPGRDTYFSATAILKVGNGISCLIKG